MKNNSILALISTFH